MIPKIKFMQVAEHLQRQILVCKVVNNIFIKTDLTDEIYLRLIRKIYKYKIETRSGMEARTLLELKTSYIIMRTNYNMHKQYVSRHC